MTTGIYWVAMVATSVFVFYKMQIAAEHNVAGVKKVKGKLVRFAYPAHFTFFGIYLAYMAYACVIVVVLYFATAFLLDYTGLSSQCHIKTGLRAIANSFVNIGK